ncbi:hypothetical protein VPNG_05528 [Cytospora leucostoma]|uniref:Developmental regulatory protein wetA n=1 Tax=Cytospora leucostoma TaxID=1230097 RepID=A0A423XBD2_9PEZI|nr:hypothetical protein VPNG_05528 [Cytospora leucostoma]
MAFAREMDYNIDKDEFWQLSCANGPLGTGHSSSAEEQQRIPSDFFDQFVVMEDGTGADFTRRPSGDNLFVPLQGDHQGQGGDGISPLTSSVGGDLNSNLSNTDSAALSYTTSNLSGVDGSAQLASLATTHHEQNRPAPQSQVTGRNGKVDTTHHVVLGQLDPDTLEQRRRLLSGRRGQNPQPASGSISDSELLQLEGLSVNSPRRIVPHLGAASSTSPSMQAFGPTPTTGNIAGLSNNIDLSPAKNQQSHKSGTRSFETIYSTIRRAVGGHSRGRAQHQHPKTAPIPQTVIPSHMESTRKGTRKLASECQPTSTAWNGLPISPPLTELAHTRSNDAAVFVNGYIDDPFFDPTVPFQNVGGLAPAAQIHSKRGNYNGAFPHTPSRTPNLKVEGNNNGEDISHFFPSTSEPWDVNATFATTSDLSGSNALSFDGTSLDNWGLYTPSDNGTNLDHGGGGGGHPDASSRNHHNLTIQVPSYVQDHDHPGPGGPDDLATNGLMIHMPQPQTPSTAPLLSTSSQMAHMPQDGNGAASYPFPDDQQQQQQHQHPNSMHSFRGATYNPDPNSNNNNNSNHHHHQQQQQQQQQQQLNSNSRRPKPRAPSSGARYHHMGAATISPRKTRPQSCSTSSSPSPTPGNRRSRSASQRSRSLHRASTSDIRGGGGLGGGGGGGIVAPTSDAQSHAIRKRRSASSWLGGGGGGQRRTTSNNSSSSAGGGGGSVGGAAGMGDMGMMVPAAGGGGGGGGEGVGGAQIGFVNYTPNDHNVLMTGVAPSGSSKTKARREKEAMERQRKLSEAVRKAVTAAGVDVGRLKEEGIVI